MLVVCGCTASELSVSTPAGGGGPDASLADALTTAARSDLTVTEAELVEIVVGPQALSEEYRVAGFTVDDPNGTGRVDDRWYPPRIVSTESSSQVDSAPVPTVAAGFVPGDPRTPIDAGDGLEAQRDLLEASQQLSISVFVLDDAEQRDQLSSVMLDSYDGGDDADSFAREMFGNPERSPAYPAGYPGTSMEIDVFGSRNVFHQYDVGERVILVVAISAGGLLSENREELDESLAHDAIEAQVARLRDLGYG